VSQEKIRRKPQSFLWIVVQRTQRKNQLNQAFQLALQVTRNVLEIQRKGHFRIAATEESESTENTCAREQEIED